MAIIGNLYTKVSADIAPFQKGMRGAMSSSQQMQKGVSQSLRGLNSSMLSAMHIAGSFGFNTSALNPFVSSIQILTDLMPKTMSSFSSLSGAGKAMGYASKQASALPIILGNTATEAATTAIELHALNKIAKETSKTAATVGEGFKAMKTGSELTIMRKLLAEQAAAEAAATPFEKMEMDIPLLGKGVIDLMKKEDLTELEDAVGFMDHIYSTILNGKNGKVLPSATIEDLIAAKRGFELFEGSVRSANASVMRSTDNLEIFLDRASFLVSDSDVGSKISKSMLEWKISNPDTNSIDLIEAYFMSVKSGTVEGIEGLEDLQNQWQALDIVNRGNIKNLDNLSAVMDNFSSNNTKVRTQLDKLIKAEATATAAATATKAADTAVTQTQTTVTAAGVGVKTADVVVTKAQTAATVAHTASLWARVRAWGVTSLAWKGLASPWQGLKAILTAVGAAFVWVGKSALGAFGVIAASPVGVFIVTVGIAIIVLETFARVLHKVSIFSLEAWKNLSLLNFVPDWVRDMKGVNSYLDIMLVYFDELEKVQIQEMVDTKDWKFDADAVAEFSKQWEDAFKRISDAAKTAKEEVKKFIDEIAKREKDIDKSTELSNLSQVLMNLQQTPDTQEQLIEGWKVRKDMEEEFHKLQETTLENEKKLAQAQADFALITRDLESMEKSLDQSDPEKVKAFKEMLSQRNLMADSIASLQDSNLIANDQLAQQLQLINQIVLKKQEEIKQQQILNHMKQDESFILGTLEDLRYQVATQDLTDRDKLIYDLTTNLKALPADMHQLDEALALFDQLKVDKDPEQSATPWSVDTAIGSVKLGGYSGGVVNRMISAAQDTAKNTKNTATASKGIEKGVTKINKSIEGILQ